MPDIGPDIEELFRRASEGYPLKQGEDKWSEIASKISQKPAGVPIPEQRKGWQHKKYTAALLFGFLLLGYLVVNNGKKQNNPILQNAEKYTAQPTSPILNKKGGSQILPENSIQDKSLSQNKNQSIATNHSTADGRRTVSKNTDVINSGIPPKIKSDQTNNLTFAGAENKTDEKSSITKNDLVNEVSLIPLSEKESFLNTIKLSPEQYNRVKQFDGLPLNKDEAKIKTKFSKKGFYYGMVAGVDINAIKDQGFKKAGFDVGVLGGYRFSTALSIETGLLLAKKFYWTPGKYFSTDEMRSTMPAGTELTEVHGSSRILEVPLHVRYDLLRKHNYRLFTTAGFSSYIMTEENNQYYTLLNGIQGKMYGSYKKDRRYFAAAIDLGFGYEKDIGKKIHIRFEPYLQLPLKGIGIGHLPVKSAGFRIALTRSVH
jgi:DNA-directed RNA polymerase subunit H (RpoH/RPB5)